MSTNAHKVASNTIQHFEDFEEEVNDELDRVAKEARKLGRRYVPVDTGALREDISVKTGKDGWSSVYNTLEYSRRINWGFVGTDSMGRTYDQEGTYYLEDASYEAFRNGKNRLSV